MYTTLHKNTKQFQGLISLTEIHTFYITSNLKRNFFKFKFNDITKVEDKFYKNFHKKCLEIREIEHF